MHVLENEGILNRLGLTDAALSHARENDAKLDEVCLDLEKLAAALSSGPPDPDLIRLISELEAEIRQRLGATREN